MMILRAFRDDAAWRDVTERAAFAGKSLLSIGLAIHLSFFLQLHSPMTSVTTVMIVSNPVVGAMIAKSAWRIIGTILGAVLAVALMASFPQYPFLYFLALSAVIGLACMTATFFRLSRAYASVLTGYTIIVVSSPSFYNPNGLFLSSMARLSAVTVGIVVSAAVFMATSIRRPERLIAQLGAAARATMEHALNFYLTHGRDVGAQGESDAAPRPSIRGWPPSLYAERDRLLARLGALSVAAENMATDNPEIGSRLRPILAGLDGLSGIVGIFHPHWSGRNGDSALAGAIHDRMAETLRGVIALMTGPGGPGDGASMRVRLAAAIDAFTALESEQPDVSSLIVLDNARDVLTQFARALEDLSAPGPSARRAPRPPVYREWIPAVWNGLRGMLVTFLAGAIWYGTAWSNGPFFMLVVIAASSLLSTMPSAAKASPLMALGLVLAVPAGLLCHFFFLPRIDGFPLLWLTMCLFLLPGIWLQFSPRFGPAAFGYGVFFTVLLNVANPIRYDDIALTNNWFAIIMAAALLVFVFRVILPADDRFVAGTLVSSLVNGMRGLACGTEGRRLDWIAWESFQLQKIARMRVRLSLSMPSVNLAEYMDAAYATLSIGRLIVRTRRSAKSAGGDVSAQAEAALACLRDVRRDPGGTARRLRDAAGRIAAGSGPRERAPERRRIAACLLQIAHVLDEAPGFFHRDGPLQLSSRMRQSARPLSAPVPVLSPVLGIEKAG